MYLLAHVGVHAVGCACVMTPRGWPLLLCALLAPVCARASSTPAAAPGDALLSEMMDLSGTRRMIEQVPAQVQAGAMADQERLPAGVRARLAAAIAGAYAAEALYRAAFDHVKRHARPDELAAALDVLRTPVALRFTEMEVAAGTPEHQRLLPGFLSKLQSSPPPAQRIALLERLDELTGTSALLTEVTVQTAAAIARGVAGARAPLTHEQLLALDDAVARMRQQVGPATRQQALTTFLFTYRRASDEELARYVALYEGGAGQWTARVTGAATRVALEQAAVELARRLVASSAPLAPSPPPSPAAVR